MRHGEIGDPDAIGRLGRLLRDSTKSDSERVQAADALSRSRSNDDAVADAIASVLDEREAQAVRQAAGKALARVLEPVKSLETWLDSEGLDELTRKLRQIWAGLPATRDLLPRTLAALDESAIDDSGAGAWELSLDKPDAKFWAAAHLARKGNHAALKHVCFVLRDQESDERKRLKAAETLGRMEDCGYFAVWPLLWQAGEQKECTPSVREAAAKALERFFAVDGTLPDFLEVELGDYLPAWEDLVAVLIAGLPATRSVLVKTLQILDGGEENPELWQWRRLRENAEVVLRRSLHIDLVSILTNRLRSRSRPFFLVAKPRH
jgi:HEAT repeat protein